MRAQEGSVVAGLDDGEVLDPRLDAVRDAVQDGGTILRRCASPLLSRPARRSDGQVDGIGVGPRDLRDDLLVDRGDVGEPS